MVVVPAATPFTEPEALTVAAAVLVLLHTPPVAPSVSVVADPAHIAAAPLMAPAIGNELTVTT